MSEIDGGRPGRAQHLASGRIETAGWGLFLAWIGVAFLLDVGWGGGLLGVGVLLLGLQAVRAYCGVRLDGFGLVAGAVLASAGLLRLLDIRIDEAPVGVVPLALIVAGVALFVSALRGRGHD